MSTSVAATTVALFTRDLRLHDNPVLRAAAEAERVVPLFVVDGGIGGIGGFRSANKAAFLSQCLADLDDGLRGRGGRLVVRRGDVVAETRKVAEQVGADAVHVAADVSAYARRREHRLHDALGSDGRKLVVHPAAVTAVPPGEPIPSSGQDHFAVFTPYHRRWEQQSRRTPLRPPRSLRLPRIAAGDLPKPDDLSDGRSEPAPQLLPGGEHAARTRMHDWARRATDYGDGHDRLATDDTSRLSPYLHFGCVSAIELAHLVGTASTGARAFVRQLAWRDFYHQVLAARPDASRHDYRDRGDRWRDDPEAFDAWRTGRTGYPIVDAGMRQLAAEGWVHNRARLLVGSFLTKTLYLDWRLGAAHFLDHLLDGDIANNQLNWQWIAGTGTDTRPNRVLNPLLQARRYDPDGDYVRRWVPELAAVDGAAVHEPWALPDEVRDELDYPAPIVDLDQGRDRFLSARKQRS